MEKLIAYLYGKHVLSNDPHVADFSKAEPVKVLSLSEEKLQIYTPLIVRNIFTYSAANMEIRISLPHLFSFYRLQKFRKVMKKANDSQYLDEWINNEMMPFPIPVSAKLSNSQFVYIDNNQEQQKEEENKDSKKKSKLAAKQESNKKNYNIAMINVKQITRELENQLLADWLGVDLEELKKQPSREQIIERAKWVKVEEYLCEKYCQDTLMTFNFIYSCPLIDEKELLTRTMLPVVELRKCINNLIRDGIVNFYPETSRSILFRTLKRGRIIEQYRDHIAQCMLNLLTFLESQKNEQKRIMVTASLSRLDDIMMILTA